jgi:5-methyltetrahydropteroyltriglutamate--homocysteine methyltransferase
MVYVDDIGSFPLPQEVTKDEFNKIYPLAQKAYAEGKDLHELSELKAFCLAVESSLRYKINSGLDVINYPQHYDMHKQFLDAIEEHQREPYLIERKYAVIPELSIVESEAKGYYENKEEKLKLKVCVTGCIELYLKTPFGYHIYKDVLDNLAKSVNRFLKNSILNTKYVKTQAVAIDEPSLGIVDLLDVEKDDLVSSIEKSVESVSTDVQIHLHSLKAAELPLRASGVDILTGEFASSPMNMELIKKSELENYDKFIRGGVSRTNIDYIIAELMEKGITPEGNKLVDDVNEIRKRYIKAKEFFGDRMLYAGPDCGLGAWPDQKVAQLLLKRTVKAVKGVH